MTVPRVSRLLLIWQPSFNLVPADNAWDARSLPAKSTKFCRVNKACLHFAFMTWKKYGQNLSSYHTGNKCSWLVLTQELTSRTFNSLRIKTIINNEIRQQLFLHKYHKSLLIFYMQSSRRQTSLSIWCDLELFSFKYVSPVFLWAGTSKQSTLRWQ